MIAEIPTYVFTCDEFGCRYGSEPFELLSDAEADETAHLDRFHSPIPDDVPVEVTA